MNSSGKRGESKKPKRPVKPIYYSYSHEKVQNLRRALREALAFEFLDKIPRRESFSRFLDLVREILPGEVDAQVLEDSLKHVAGTRTDAKALDDVSWRMAGNYKRLLHRKAVPPWHVQTIPEWVPAVITGCRRGRNSREAMGATFEFRIVAGTSCGRLTHRWWSEKFCRFVSSEFGYTAARGRRQIRFPYSVPEQLVGTRLHLLVHPERCGVEPGFTEIRIPDTAKKWNTELVRSRFRVQPGFACLMEARVDQLPCHNCPVGFQKCQAGTHRLDWVRMECSGCKIADAFFDPSLPSALCVDCTRKDAYRRRK